MSDLVSVSIENNVADVRLNRPDKYNSLDMAMFKAVLDAGESISRNRAVRAVVLSGEGPGFCAGLDVSTFDAIKSGEQKDQFSPFERPEGSAANYVQRVAYVWKQLPVPVIAALHGVAYGGGFQISLAADIRFAALDASFSIMEIKWGLIPDMTITQTLRDLVRLDVAKEMIFSGEILSAERAEKLGLITRVCKDPLAEALELAGEISEKSPDAIIAGKRLLEEAWNADAEVGLKLEAKLQQSLLGSPNQIEAVQANFQKRAPKFQDPK